MQSSEVSSTQVKPLEQWFSDLPANKQCAKLKQFAGRTKVMYCKRTVKLHCGQTKIVEEYYPIGKRKFRRFLLNELNKNGNIEVFHRVGGNKDIYHKYSIVSKCIDSCLLNCGSPIEAQLKSEQHTYEHLNKLKNIIPIIISLFALLAAQSQPYIEALLVDENLSKIQNGLGKTLVSFSIIYLASVAIFYLIDFVFKRNIRSVLYLLNVIQDRKKSLSNNTNDKKPKTIKRYRLTPVDSPKHSH